MLPKNSLYGSVNAELYLDSEQTIINDLKNTFSQKGSHQFNNNSILKINTSTYSVARTASHISQRLNEVSQRLKSIQTSVSKSKCKIGIDQRVGKNLYQNQKEEGIFTNGEVEMMSRIRKNGEQIAKQKVIIQELQQKLAKTENQLLSQQEKYLKKQNAFIKQVNRLKSLAQSKVKNENIFFNQKLQFERMIDEEKVKSYELSNKLSLLQKQRKVWNKKEIQLKKAIQKFKAIQQQLTKPSEKKQNISNIFSRIKKILQIEQQFHPILEQENNNKQNITQNCSRRVQSSKNSLRGSVVSQESTKQTIESMLFDHEEHNFNTSSEQNQQFYRMLFVQATTLQQLLIH